MVCDHLLERCEDLQACCDALRAPQVSNVEVSGNKGRSDLFIPNQDAVMEGGEDDDLEE